MDRRTFLRRSTVALAGGLLVGDAALEAFERLTHRKVFALGGLDDAMARIYRKTNHDIMEAMKQFTEEYAWLDEVPDRPKSLFGGVITVPRNEMSLSLVYGSAA